MPSTKILNVQRGESFDEVFDAFTSTDAKEVIFIFPKGSIFGKNAEYLQTIQAEAARADKTISIMTADPVIAHLAAASKINLLQAPTPRRRSTPAVLAQQAEPEPEPEVQPEPEPEALEVLAEEPVVAELAVARKKQPLQQSVIHDIIPSQSEEPEVRVHVHSEIPPAPTPIIPPQRPLAPSPVAVVPPPPSNITDIEKLWEMEEKRQNPLAGAPVVKQKTHLRFSKRFIFIPLVAGLVVLGFVLYTTLGKASVTVHPKTQNIDFKLRVTAAATVSEVNTDFNRIPGQQFTVQQEVSGSYPSTAQKEVAQKASGTIRIYNTSSSSQRLVATTRFETSGGLIFRIPETITVPASGSLQSLAYADQVGKDYNVGPSRFTIPGFAGTPRASQFYAVSTEPMKGGVVGNAKVVAEQDFVRAQEELTAKAKEEVKKALKEQVGELMFLEPIEVVVQAPAVNAKAGEAADTLEMKVKASVSVVAFRFEDLESLIKNYLEKNGNLDLIKEHLEVTYAPRTNDSVSKTLIFDVQIVGRGAEKVDREKILADIQGKNEEAVRAYIAGLPNVESARILLSPRWVTKVPQEVEKITITVEPL